VCDESGRTSAERVLAAGDAARFLNPVAGRHLGVEHWGEALAQGESAGRTAAGSEVRWDAVPGFWSTIGERTIKQAAWGDGHDEVRLRDSGDGWTAWYGREGRCVGVLTHQRDEDYERGSELVAAGAPLP
jgi:NADPH-dependent 2,4-dienoyl-CoA reductase/sulfur reductase-like enzyme